MLSHPLRPLWQGQGSRMSPAVAGCGSWGWRSRSVTFECLATESPSPSILLLQRSARPRKISFVAHAQQAEGDFKTPNSCHQMAAPTGGARVVRRAAPVSSFIKVLSVGKRERSPHSLHYTCKEHKSGLQFPFYRKGSLRDKTKFSSKRQ